MRFVQNSFPSYGNPEIQGHNPQSKVKKSKENSEATPPAFPENPLPSKPEKEMEKESVFPVFEIPSNS
jgi:hypothetical protein